MLAPGTYVAGESPTTLAVVLKTTSPDEGVPLKVLMP
jgi:hypothetical protein